MKHPRPARGDNICILYIRRVWFPYSDRISVLDFIQCLCIYGAGWAGDVAGVVFGRPQVSAIYNLESMRLGRNCEILLG